MNPVDSPSALETPSLQVEAIKHRWVEGSLSPDTHAALASHPELADHPSMVVDLALEEFCLRRGAGEAIDPESFCARFPAQRAQLRQALELHVEFSSLQSFFDELPNHPAALALVQTLKLEPLVPGMQLGDLTLVRELGRGGFSRVFLATESSTGDRPVVVKLSTGGGDEARALGRLAHPNIIPILSTRRDEAFGLTVVCMPFQGSRTLEDVLTHLFSDPARALPRWGTEILEAAAATHPGDPRVPVAEVDSRLSKGSYVEGVLHLGLRLAETLAFLHARSFYHRDLKPANVLLTPDGRPLLLDFNLSEDGCVPRTAVGGTVCYMAPEQIARYLKLITAPDGVEPQAPPDGRADLYSLGVMLFQLLTGKHPFAPIPLDLLPAEMGPLMLERQRQLQPALRKLNPEVPPSVARLIERCLAFDPADRPRDATAVAAELKRYFRPLPRLRRWLGRHPRLCAAVLALTLLSAAATMWAIATRPSVVEVLIQQGDTALRGQDPVAARDAYRKALEHEPGNPRLWFRLGQTYLATKDLVGALPSFEKANQLRPNHGPTLACLAYCFARNFEPDPAIEHGEAAVQHGMETAPVYNNLAFSYKLKGNNQKAWLRVEKALHLDPHLGAAHYNRAKWSVESSAPLGVWPGQALEDIDKALAECPPHYQITYYAAYLRLRALSKLPPAEHAARKDEIVDLLGRAMDQGMTFEMIRQRLPGPDLLQIDRRADFQELKKRSPGVPSVANPLLAPPCPDHRGD